MTRAPTVQIRRVRPGQDDDLSLPRYMTDGAAGLDLPAAIDEPRVIEPGQRMLVPTGFAVALPAGFEAQVRPRSGLALKHGVTLANAPGTIDSDYRGELNAILINLGDEAFELRRGERIAQLVVAPVTQAILQEVRELPDSERAAGGFGHTGT